MPKHRGLWRQQWAKCERDYFDYPISYLTRQKGLLLCPGCLDNLDVELRPALIAEILSDGQESRNDREWVATGDTNDEIVF